MKTPKNLLLAILSAAFFTANSAHALFGPPDKTYTPSGNWDVGHQQNIGKSGKGICYAHTTYNSGKIQIWIGSRLEVEDRKDSWFLAIYNKDWTWIKPDRTYRLIFLPPQRKKVYWVDFATFRHNDGLIFLVSDINVEFANALALEKRKGSVGIFASDKRPLASLELTDSAGAIREVVHCRQDILTTAAAHGQPPQQTNPGHDGSEHYGTGFFVAPHYVLTNMHVMKGCAEGWVKYADYRAERAYIAGCDETNDLALLRTEMVNNGIATFRFAPRLGEAAYAYGFPLAGLLSTSGNFTIGNITSLSGMNDDTRVLQTSTPVQPGNSGGPLLDDRGTVIGVVEKKLDAIMVASVTGDVPQNVNFAIQSPIAVNFLATKGIVPSFGKVENKLDPADIADRAKAFTVQVFCK